MHQIFRFRSHSAEDAEYSLNEEGRRRELAVRKVGEVVEMPDVVAFELEARAVITHLLQAPLDLRERVREDEILGHVEVGLLPVIFEFLDFRARRGNIE